MTIRYRVVGEAEDKAVSISSFAEFGLWLHDLGCGDENPDQEILARWLGIYKSLGRPEFKPVSIARTRKSTTPWTIIIIGADIDA